MATQAERKALLFFGAVIALGVSVRAVRLSSHNLPADRAAREALELQIGAADSARHAKFRRAKGHRGSRKTQQPAAKVDLDVASEAEIESLKGIGPALARRIVAERDSFGPFGSLEGLGRVRGLRPALVAKLDSTVTFSLLPRPMNTVIPGRSGRPAEWFRHRPKGRGRDTLR